MMSGICGTSVADRSAHPSGRIDRLARDSRQDSGELFERSVGAAPAVVVTIAQLGRGEAVLAKTHHGPGAIGSEAHCDQRFLAVVVREPGEDQLARAHDFTIDARALNHSAIWHAHRQPIAPPACGSISVNWHWAPPGGGHCPHSMPSQASNTRCGGASNRRLISSEGDGETGSAFLCAGIGRSLVVLQVLIETVEALVPEFAVEVEPLACAGHCTCVEPAHAVLAAPLTHDQRRCFEHA